MKDKIDNNKIKALLDRWYSGLTTPEEERLLAKMLALSEELPPDMEADRKLFCELHSTSEMIPEMPDAYSSRINAALENEMASERKRVVPTILSRFRRGWIGRIAVVAAVFFACAFFAMKMIDTPQMEMPGENMALNDNAPKKLNMSDDTLQNHYLALQASHLEMTHASSEEQAYKKIANSGERKGGKKKNDEKMMHRSSKSDYASEDVYSADEDSYPHSDETNFIRENYRVVRDQDEADAILNSIFSRLESNVAMETSKLSKIDLEYDSEMSRLSGIENVGLLKEYSHEKTPL